MEKKEILDKKLKTVSIKGKDYIEVKERILALAESTKYSIETDYQYFEEKRIWVVKAKLTLHETGEIYTGLAQEVESDNYKEVNATSALENAETSAVGRACAMAGIGVLKSSFASADEVSKAINRGSIFNTETKKTDLPKHTCKKCGEVVGAEIFTGNYGPCFKCSECGNYSKPNPFYENGEDLSKTPDWDTGEKRNKTN